MWKVTAIGTLKEESEELSPQDAEANREKVFPNIKFFICTDKIVDTKCIECCAQYTVIL